MQSPEHRSTIAPHVTSVRIFAGPGLPVQPAQMGQNMKARENYGTSDTTPTTPKRDADEAACTRYIILLRIGDWWAGRRDRRGLKIVDVDRLAQTGGEVPAAHLRWIRARGAEFAEQDRRLYARMEEMWARDIERLNERVLSLDQLFEEAAAAQALLDAFPPISEAELSRRTLVEADDDESVIRLRRAREYENRRHPLAARAATLQERHAAAQHEIAELTSRIHRRFDTTQQIARARYAFYTRRVETYLRVLLHRSPNRESVMALLPAPVIARPKWFDQPCPWPTQPVAAPTEEVSP